MLAIAAGVPLVLVRSLHTSPDSHLRLLPAWLFLGIMKSGASFAAMHRSVGFTLNAA